MWSLILGLLPFLEEEDFKSSNSNIIFEIYKEEDEPISKQNIRDVLEDDEIQSIHNNDSSSREPTDEEFPQETEKGLDINPIEINQENAEKKTISDDII
ncbi:3330_t:CDS:2 [Diversispora eburnea]|uniref:3330_t:CDS:1 n=1 Tax=Diversispora eburnea TaxID=1213867 RepID=A0A9N9GKK0_9GLOM|nr:3330_t:CDS:2 [Diversispora eburnea]